MDNLHYTLMTKEKVAIVDLKLPRKWPCKTFRPVMQIYTKLANFGGLYFPIFYNILSPNFAIPNLRILFLAIVNDFVLLA